MKAVIILLDTTRPDHLGCYGYFRPTSPNLDKVAEAGVRFTNAFAVDTPCVPSQANKFTGQSGTRNGVVTHGERGHRLRPGSTEQLQHHFSRHGHQTCAVSTVVGHAPFFYPGWNTYLRPNYNRGMQQITAKEINQAALPWLREHAKEDFLLFIHYWDPHTPYQLGPQEIFNQYYQGDPSKEDPRMEPFFRNEPIRIFHQLYRGPERPPNAPPEIKDLDWFIAQYDTEITYTDCAVGEVMRTLEECGIAEESAVFILSDHGEHFGEQEMFFDHSGVYEPTQKIVMIARYPGRYPEGLVCDELVTNCDLMPTLLKFAEIAPEQILDGEDLTPLVTGQVPKLRDEVFLCHGLWTAQRAVRTREWKLIRTWDPGFWSMPPLALYNLKSDPRETVNLIQEQPEVAARLEHKLLSWTDQVLAGRTDPLMEALVGGLCSRHWVERDCLTAGKILP